MNFIDVTALADATEQSEDNQDIGNLALFDTQTEQVPYGTLEHNLFALNGSKNEVPDNPEDIAFWSSLRSGKECLFSDNPVIDITFSKQHSSAGITLYFAEDYPTELKITWYSLAGTKIEDKTFYPDDLICVCRNQVLDFGRLKIEFIQTRMPYSYVKLQRIMYGLYLTWEDDRIQSAKVQEEIDLTSATLSINKAEVSIVDETNDFDIGNENGAWKSVQKMQGVRLTEYKDGELIPLGTFFMDEHSFKDNVASFSLIDSIGLMDKHTFYDGEVYSNVKAGVILEKIFQCAGVAYEIAEDVYNTLLTGHLPIKSCRVALQSVCFACGAVADDSRSSIVKIYKPDRYVKSMVGINRKFSGKTKIALDDYVSGVCIECNSYALEDKTVQLHKDVLPVGDTMITFSNPCVVNELVVSAGTIKEAHPNYVIVTMTEEAECIITGKKYVANKFVYQKNVERLQANEVENIKKFGTCTLYNSLLLKDNAERLLNHFNLRKKVDMKYLLELEQVGNWANVQEVGGNVSTTVIESQTIDLTGGFISDASCRGYSIVVTENFYTGTELYAGGGGLL